MTTIEKIEKITGKRTITRQVQEDGAEATIKAIEKTLKGPPYWMCSTIHFKFAEELGKAKKLIEEGRFDELLAIDEQLADLYLQDLFD